MTDRGCPGAIARRAFLARTLALLALPSAAGAVALPTPEPHAEGRLWRITRGRIPQSFAFGTIHLADPRVSAIPPVVADALAQTRTLALEIAPVQVLDAELDQLEVMEDGRRLEPLIGAEAFEELRYRLFMTGTPERVIARLKPWAAMLRLGVHAPHHDVRSLEENLLAHARRHRMSWMSLESVEEQAAAFDTIPLESQVALLKHALLHPDAASVAAAASIAAWQRGDLAALAEVPREIGQRFPDMRTHYESLARHVIVNRTALIHHRLFLPLRSGRVFAAVGASHLGGREGLLAMLVADGYRLKRVW